MNKVICRDRQSSKKVSRQEGQPDGCPCVQVVEGAADQYNQVGDRGRDCFVAHLIQI